ncbi:hypothetical protein [Pyrobaculum aerophilum]|uniref:hypothetical protein n=1 Tax=Pyrobaculum aerophilum TaxID=13773 RepID=UPI002FDB2FFF
MRLKKRVYLRIHPHVLESLESLTPEKAITLCRQIGPYDLISAITGIVFNYTICKSLALNDPQRLAELLKRVILALLRSGVEPVDQKSYSAMKSWARYFEQLAPSE